MPSFSQTIHLSQQDVVDIINEWVKKQVPDNTQPTSIHVNIGNEAVGYGEDAYTKTVFKGIDVKIGGK
jgi:hypothetical protein